MAKIDKTYHQLLEKILTDGFKYEDPNRKGIYRYQIPHYQIKHDLQHSFPAITTKKLFWKGIVGELLWFLRGDTNIKYLINNNINIWNKDGYKFFIKNSQEFPIKPSLEEFLKEIKKGSGFGQLGRIYGAQWRNWKGSVPFIKKNGETGHDQISNLIKDLKENPMGARHIVTAWNPAELDNMALPPCHWSFEILVEPISLKESISNSVDEMLDFSTIPPISKGVIDATQKYQFTLKWHQRSVDTFLGLPFNIASYALLAHIIGKMTNMVPKNIIGDLSNVHIYEPHLDGVKKQLSRSTNYHNSRCELKIKAHLDEDFIIENDNKKWYINEFQLTPHHECKAIKAEMIPYK